MTMTAHQHASGVTLYVDDRFGQEPTQVILQGYDTILKRHNDRLPAGAELVALANMYAMQAAVLTAMQEIRVDKFMPALEEMVAAIIDTVFNSREAKLMATVVFARGITPPDVVVMIAARDQEQGDEQQGSLH